MKIDTIKQRLSDEIKQSHKKQKWIAEQLKLHPSNICDYVKQNQIPKLDIFSDLCILLDLDANYILGITDYCGKKS